MPYFTLLQRDNESAPWGIEFGDHMKATVETEAEFYRGQGYRRADQKIIKTRTSRQAEIDSAIAKLNASELLPEDSKNTVSPQRQRYLRRQNKLAESIGRSILRGDPAPSKREMTEAERGQCIAALLHHANFMRELSTLQGDGMTERMQDQFARQALADESLADAIEQAESITLAKGRAPR